MRAKTKQAKKNNKINNELNNKIKQLQDQLEKVERELLPPIETQCCNLCKATLPLTEFKLLKNLKHTKGCVKCLEKRREKSKQRVQDVATDSDSSQGGPTIELFQLTEMIKLYCQNNNTTVLNVARTNYPQQIGYIMSHFNNVRLTRNQLAHPITPFDIQSPKELIELLMNFKI